VIDRHAIVNSLEELDGIATTVDKDKQASVCNLLAHVIPDKTADTSNSLSESLRMSGIEAYCEKKIQASLDSYNYPNNIIHL
jgi:hypothetical protein